MTQHKTNITTLNIDTKNRQNTTHKHTEHENLKEIQKYHTPNETEEKPHETFPFGNGNSRWLTKLCRRTEINKSIGSLSQRADLQTS